MSLVAKTQIQTQINVCTRIVTGGDGPQLSALKLKLSNETDSTYKKLLQKEIKVLESRRTKNKGDVSPVEKERAEKMLPFLQALDALMVGPRFESEEN